MVRTPKLIERLLHDGLDMLVASRLEQHEGDSFRPFHRFGNLLITRTISLLFRIHLTDLHSGYRVLSRRFVHVVRLRMGGFEVETEMTLLPPPDERSEAPSDPTFLLCREPDISKLV